MLDSNILEQLKGVYQKLENEVTLVVARSAHEKQNELLELAKGLKSTSEKIILDLRARCDGDQRPWATRRSRLPVSQAGIVTDTSHTKARIIEVKAHRIRAALDEGKIVLVAGFQGVSQRHLT